MVSPEISERRDFQESQEAVAIKAIRAVKDQKEFQGRRA